MIRPGPSIARLWRGVVRAGFLACALVAVFGPGATGRVLAETRPGYGGKVHSGLAGEPVTLDPARASSHAELTLVSLVFDTLYHAERDATGGDVVVVPHLAAALPELSPDGLEARIAIRPGVVFYDGRTLTAGDVVASLVRLASTPARWLLAPVKRDTREERGAAASRPAIRADGDVVVIRLAHAAPELGLLLAAPATAITPRGRAPDLAHPGRVAGSGPFRLVRVDRARHLVHLAAAPRHFAGRPYLDELTLRWFERPDEEATQYEAGRSHVSLRGQVAFAGHVPAYRTDVMSSGPALLAYVGFGDTARNGAITQNRDFRRALSLALDRNSFRGVGTGEPIVATIHPVPGGFGGRATLPAARRAQLGAARTTLASAARSVPLLARSTSGKERVELELVIDQTQPDDREIAEKVVAALFRLGIAARITAVAAAEFRDRVDRGACDLYIGQLVAPVPSGELAMAAAFATGNDDWAEATLAAGPLDSEAATRAFARRLPVVPLFHRALRVHHRSDVRGLHLDSTASIGLDDVFFFGQPEKSR